MRRAASSSLARSQPRSVAAAAASSRLTFSSDRSKAGRERRSCTRRAMIPPMASSARMMTMISQVGTAASLQHDVARLQMGADLALDALQRVVHGLAVALEPLTDSRVGVAVEV